MRRHLHLQDRRCSDRHRFFSSVCFHFQVQFEDVFRQCSSAVAKTQASAADRIEFTLLLTFYILFKGIVYIARNSFTTRKLQGWVFFFFIAGALDRKCCRFLIFRCLTCNLKLIPNTLVHLTAFLMAAEGDSASELTELTVSNMNLGRGCKWVERMQCSVLMCLRDSPWL